MKTVKRDTICKTISFQHLDSIFCMIFIKYFCEIYGTRNERISGISGETRAHWLMIDDRTLGISTAHAGAGIGAFVSYAHQIRWTIGINDALGSTR